MPPVSRTSRNLGLHKQLSLHVDLDSAGNVTDLPPGLTNANLGLAPIVIATYSARSEQRPRSVGP